VSSREREDATAFVRAHEPPGVSYTRRALDDEQSKPDVLRCADCGREIAWRSDEAEEWPTVEDAGAFRTVCFDCYGSRYGADEARQAGQETSREQADDRRGEDPL
jgi:hypothetical protein